MSFAFFVVDAGPEYGFGHLRRCLTLALELKIHGINSTFFSEQATSEVVSNFHWVAASVNQWPGFIAHLVNQLAQKPDLIIVDSYHANQQIINKLRTYSPLLIQMHDIGQPWSGADIIINPVLTQQPKTASSAKWLTGPKYALLRREFIQTPQKEISDINNILITLGGAAKKEELLLVNNIIDKVLSNINSKKTLDVHVRTIIGPFSDITLNEYNYTSKIFLKNPDMYSEMLNADVALSAGGQTLYELMATGTPTVALQIASNQTDNINYFVKKNALIYGGALSNPEWVKTCYQALYKLFTNFELRQRLSTNGQVLVDALGAQRVTAAILEILKNN